MNVGENIRNYRKKLGYSSNDLASFLNCSGNTITQYERGERKISVEMLIKISEALHTTPDNLLYNTDDLDLKIAIDKVYGYKNMDIDYADDEIQDMGILDDVLKYFGYETSKDSSYYSDLREFKNLIKMFINSKKFEDSQKGEK